MTHDFTDKVCRQQCDVLERELLGEYGILPDDFAQFAKDMVGEIGVLEVNGLRLGERGVGNIGTTAFDAANIMHVVAKHMAGEAAQAPQTKRDKQGQAESAAVADLVLTQVHVRWPDMAGVAPTITAVALYRIADDLAVMSREGTPR